MCNTIESYQIDIDGNEFTVEINADYGMGLPWIEYDGYGVVEQRTNRSYMQKPKKAPHEVILWQEGPMAYFYDIKATIDKAKQEGWGVANPPADWTKKQIRTEAIKRDMENCRRWLTGDNFWVWVRVKCGDYSDSLCGIEATYSDGLKDAKEYALEIAQELASQIKKEKSESDYWASRDVCTV